MGWTYRGVFSTAASTAAKRDQVRVLIGDTVSTSPQLDDEFIDWTLTQWANVYMAAALCCEALSGKVGQTDVASKSVGDLSISYGERTQRWASKAREYRMQAALGAKPFASGISEGGKTTYTDDTDIVQPFFRRGTHLDPFYASTSSTR